MLLSVLSVASGIASAICAVSRLLAVIALLPPALVCPINDIADFVSSIERDAVMKIAKPVQPIQTRSTLTRQYVRCVANCRSL
jgi:hypothetical protein